MERCNKTNRRMKSYMPTDYCKYVFFTADYAKLYLEKYGNLLKWKNDGKEIIADVGCANGAIATDILSPFWKNKFEEIIGIDISKDMIKLACERNKTQNISFVEMDIATKDLNVDMLGKFQHIFSFCCLHMVTDKRQCAENFFKMLKPDGELFLTFEMRNTFVEHQYTMCENEKWSKYLEDFRKTYRAFFTSEQDMENIFTDAGFLVECYKEKCDKIKFNPKEFENIVRYVSIVVNYIPENQKEEFRREELGLMKELCKNGDSYEISFQQLVVIARKTKN